MDTARPADDFAAMIPFLEKTVELSREYSGFLRLLPLLPIRISTTRRRHDNRISAAAIYRPA